MNKEDKVNILIKKLISESKELEEIEIPKNYEDKRRFLRALMNIIIKLFYDRGI